MHPNPTMAATHSPCQRRVPMPTIRRLGGAVCCAMAIVGAAHADAAVAYSEYVSADNLQQLNRVTLTGGTTSNSPGTYSVDATGNGASATSDSAAGGSAFVSTQEIGGDTTAWVTIAYRVTLVGPAAAVSVPVRFVANGHVQGDSQAGSSIVLDFGTNTLSASADTTGSSDTFSLDQVGHMSPNSFFDVYMEVDSESNGSGNIPSAPVGSSAFIDPSFTIDDPAYASLYHLDGIPGQIASSVPEAPCSLLIILGLGVLGATQRRRSAGRTPSPSYV